MTRGGLPQRHAAPARPASGATTANQGEKGVSMTTEAGQARMMSFQVADITKPLAPAGRIMTKGHRIVLNDHDAYIEHKQTGRRVKLHNKGNILSCG